MVARDGSVVIPSEQLIVLNSQDPGIFNRQAEGESE